MPNGRIVPSGPLVALVAAALVATGCDTVMERTGLAPSQSDIQARGWTEARDVDPADDPEVYCYSTIAEPDCYKDHQASWHHRLINQDIPPPPPGRSIVTGQRTAETAVRRLPNAEAESDERAVSVAPVDELPPANGAVTTEAAMSASSGAAEADAEASESESGETAGDRATVPAEDAGGRATDPAPVRAAQADFLARVRERLGADLQVRRENGTLTIPAAAFFESGSAQVRPDAEARIVELARLATQAAEEIPQDVPWRLRVDGHTDPRPVTGGPFDSNWELSAARASRVATLLAEAGVPNDRLMAAGWGATRPIDDRTTPEGHQRNRRIELSLTTS